MNLLIAARCSTGWMVGMVGTCTKLRYHSRPIHSTPEITCSQRMAKVDQAMSRCVICPVTPPMTSTMTMSSTTPAMTVFRGDVKMAPMSISPTILLKELANSQGHIVISQTLAFNAAGNAYYSMASPYRAPAASHRFVLDEVRRVDRDRFLAALFAPEPQRSDL